jgi:hypothetical protein
VLSVVVQLLGDLSAASLQVLRQQALDYNTWKHDQEENYAAHYKAMYVSAAAAVYLQQPEHITTTVQHPPVKHRSLCPLLHSRVRRLMYVGFIFNYARPTSN